MLGSIPSGDAYRKGSLTMTALQEKIRFSGHDGKPLAALLNKPAGVIRSVAIFAHCFTCSKDIFAARQVAMRLTGLGFAVLRFDFTGLGHSEGEFANTNFSSNVEDLCAAADYLSSVGMAPSLLIGHSLGGAAVIKAAPDIPSIKAIATIGAPGDPAHVAHNFGEARAEIEAAGIAEVILAGRPFTIKKQSLRDIEQASLAEAQQRFKGATLIMHAPLDNIVGIENAADIFMRSRHPKSFISLDGADHLLSRQPDAEYAAQLIGAWADRYLPPIDTSNSEGPEEGVVRSAERHKVTLTQDIFVGDKFRLVGDEPKSVGGSDFGPTPYQFLAAGLASCTSLTLRIYAKHKGLDLTSVAVDVSHDKIHAEDCEACEQTDGKIDQFTRRIHIHGNLSSEERQKLLEIADKCPVHRTLHAVADIQTELSSL